MAITTFTPAIAPSPGTGEEIELKLLSAQFGDGYTQTTRDGLNHIRKSLSLSWDLLTPSQADAILNVMRAYGGDTPFLYTPSDEATPVQWVCKKWSFRRNGGGMRSVSLTFEADFSIVP